jgi:Uncharacterized conserved protein, contains double-stranded beta-helix domain
MVSVTIRNLNRKITGEKHIAEYLASIGIQYEKWDASRLLSENATSEEILRAYEPEIERLKKEGGYITADVIDINKNTRDLNIMLDKFNKEHWHDEDEVRYTVKGHGLFHVHTKDGDTVAIEVCSGDLLRVPKGTMHWFDLCSDMEIRAIRLFQKTSGWTPYYSGSNAEKSYQPLCFGPAFIKTGE